MVAALLHQLFNAWPIRAINRLLSGSCPQRR